MSPGRVFRAVRYPIRNMLSNGMRTAQKVLFIAAFICAASEFIFEEMEEDSIYSPFKQASLNAGACYERPIGKCELDGNKVTGCSGTSGYGGIFKDPSGKTLQGVVCSVDCSSIPCPSPPKGSTECFDFGRNFCGIKCSYDRDCPDAGYCQQVGYDGICLFKP